MQPNVCDYAPSGPVGIVTTCAWSTSRGHDGCARRYPVRLYSERTTEPVAGECRAGGYHRGRLPSA